MLHSKRMVLVDEKFLEHVLRKQDSSWKRPAEQNVKSQLNRELKSDLDDSSIPDDIKVKQHQQHLSRFLHTNRQLPEPSKNVISPSTEDLIKIEEAPPAVDDLLDLQLEPIKSKKKKRKAPSVAIRYSKRKPKPKKSIWEEWTT